MGKSKLKKYRVHLVATLPCSASMVVEAENEQEAEEYADAHYGEADWDGADCSRPSGCDVEVFSVNEIDT